MKKNKNIVILDKPQTNGVIGNYNLEEVPIYGWEIASPRRVYDQQILNDLALQDLMAKRSSWTENPIVGPTISTVPRSYVNPDSVYTETLNTTGDIFAAMTARDNARISNNNIDKNLANWALAKQFALNAVTPTKGLSDDLNDVGLATGIGMFGPLATYGLAHLLPTTAAGWGNFIGGILGAEAVDRIIAGTTDYDGWTDMMLDKTKNWGDDRSPGRALGYVLAYAGNPGGLIGGLSFDDLIPKKQVANFADDLIPKKQVAVATPEGYVVKVPANQSGIEMTSNKWNWENWPWSKPATPETPVAPVTPEVPAAKIDGTKYTLGPKNRFLIERGVKIDPEFNYGIKREMKGLQKDVKEEFAVVARDHYENTLEPVNKDNYEFLLSKAKKRFAEYQVNRDILRNKPIWDDNDVVINVTEDQKNNALKAIKTRNSEISYRDPAAEKLNWFTHPITNTFSPKPAGWSQNNPKLSNLEKFGSTVLEAMLPTYYGRQIIGLAPEGIDWLVFGPDENETESEELKQEQSEPTYDSANLKEMIKRQNERRSGIDSLNNIR